jgi:Spy/CpxP family protein refolding chaperone
MKRKAIIVGFLTLVLATSALAGHGMRGSKSCHHGPGFGQGGDMARPGMIFRMADEIGLTEKQKTEIMQLMEKNAMQRIEKEAELEKAQVKLRHLRMSEAPESEILYAMDRVGALKTELRKMQFQHHNQIKALLTEEQLDKLEELRKDFQSKNRSGRFQGRGDGPGRGFGDCDGDGPHGRGFGFAPDGS